ncbi:MAG: hypothetical protein JW937_03685 [Candidatus Omnitrophica bacterium]|nr:hypothetical protein [Candidatus Omnitrophota bacterium]
MHLLRKTPWFRALGLILAQVLIFSAAPPSFASEHTHQLATIASFEGKIQDLNTLRNWATSRQTFSTILGLAQAQHMEKLLREVVETDRSTHSYCTLVLLMTAAREGHQLRNLDWANQLARNDPALIKEINGLLLGPGSAASPESATDPGLSQVRAWLSNIPGIPDNQREMTATDGPGFAKRQSGERILADKADQERHIDAWLRVAYALNPNQPEDHPAVQSAQEAGFGIQPLLDWLEQIPGLVPEIKEVLLHLYEEQGGELFPRQINLIDPATPYQIQGPEDIPVLIRDILEWNPEQGLQLTEAYRVPPDSDQPAPLLITPLDNGLYQIRPSYGMLGHVAERGTIHINRQWPSETRPGQLEEITPERFCRTVFHELTELLAPELDGEDLEALYAHLLLDIHPDYLAPLNQGALRLAPILYAERLAARAELPDVFLGNNRLSEAEVRQTLRNALLLFFRYSEEAPENPQMDFWQSRIKNLDGIQVQSVEGNDRTVRADILADTLVLTYLAPGHLRHILPGIYNIRDALFALGNLDPHNYLPLRVFVPHPLQSELAAFLQDAVRPQVDDMQNRRVLDQDGRSSIDPQLRELIQNINSLEDQIGRGNAPPDQGRTDLEDIARSVQSLDRATRTGSYLQTWLAQLEARFVALHELRQQIAQFTDDTWPPEYLNRMREDLVGQYRDIQSELEADPGTVHSVRVIRQMQNLDRELSLARFETRLAGAEAEVARLKREIDEFTEFCGGYTGTQFLLVPLPDYEIGTWLDLTTRLEYFRRRAQNIREGDQYDRQSMGSEYFPAGMASMFLSDLLRIGAPGDNPSIPDALQELQRFRNTVFERLGMQENPSGIHRSGRASARNQLKILGFFFQRWSALPLGVVDPRLNETAAEIWDRWEMHIALLNEADQETAGAFEDLDFEELGRDLAVVYALEQENTAALRQRRAQNIQRRMLFDQNAQTAHGLIEQFKEEWKELERRHRILWTLSGRFGDSRADEFDHLEELSGLSLKVLIDHLGDQYQRMYTGDLRTADLSDGDNATQLYRSATQDSLTTLSYMRTHEYPDLFSQALKVLWTEAQEWRQNPWAITNPSTDVHLVFYDSPASFTPEELGLQGNHQDTVTLYEAPKSEILQVFESGLRQLFSILADARTAETWDVAEPIYEELWDNLFAWGHAMANFKETQMQDYDPLAARSDRALMVVPALQQDADSALDLESAL